MPDGPARPRNVTTKGQIVYGPHPHEGLLTVDAMGVGTLHDTLADALEHVAQRPDEHIYWCQRTPLTPSMMAYLCLT